MVVPDANRKKSSTYSSEFVALRFGVEEGIAAMHLLQSIGVEIDMPIDIYCDSKSVIKSIITVSGELKRRHVSIDYHMVREAFAQGIVDLYHIAGGDNPVDILTKEVGRVKFFRHTNRILTNPRIVKMV